MSTIVLSEKKVEEELGGLWRLLKLYLALSLSQDQQDSTGQNGQDSTAKDIVALAAAAASPVPLPNGDEIVKAARRGFDLISKRYSWAT